MAAEERSSWLTWDGSRRASSFTAWLARWRWARTSSSSLEWRSGVIAEVSTTLRGCLITRLEGYAGSCGLVTPGARPRPPDRSGVASRHAPGSGGRDAEAGDPRPAGPGGGAGPALARVRGGLRRPHRQARRAHRPRPRRRRRADGQADGRGPAGQPGDRGVLRAPPARLSGRRWTAS